MNLYRTLGRWYVQIDFGNPYLGTRFAVGRWAKDDYVFGDEYAGDDTYPAHIECPEAHMGNVISPVGAHSFEAIKEAHEDSPQAIGSFLDEVVRLNELEHAGKLTESEVDRAIVRAKNWVDQERDGS